VGGVHQLGHHESLFNYSLQGKLWSETNITKHCSLSLKKSWRAIFFLFSFPAFYCYFLTLFLLLSSGVTMNISIKSSIIISSIQSWAHRSFNLLNRSSLLREPWFLEQRSDLIKWAMSELKNPFCWKKCREADECCRCFKFSLFWNHFAHYFDIIKKKIRSNLAF